MDLIIAYIDEYKYEIERTEYNYMMLDAARFGSLDVLEWIYMRGRGIELDISLANAAIINGHLNVLKWLSKYNIFPETNTLGICFIQRV